MKTNNHALPIPLPDCNEAFKVIHVSKRTPFNKLSVVSNEEIRFIAYEEILYCKSSGNYTTIFTRKQKSFLCSKTLKHIEAKLPQDLFFRIHQSYLINLQCITALKKQACKIELDNQFFIPFSREKKPALYKLLNA